MSELVDFSRRAYLEEEMDGLCSYEELRDCLRDLALVNRLVFAHRPIFQWLERVVAARAVNIRKLRIVDVGCGYGDMLRRIEKWAAKRDVAVDLIGVDINAHAIRAAREATPAASRIEWVLGDACEAIDDVDLVTSCGVMHHLSESEIVRLLQWAERTSRLGWFLCDLHRKPGPYRIFDAVMRVGRWHRFIRPDGLRSIRRSFLADDWQQMCAAAGLVDAVRIEEYRPARLCVEKMKRSGERVADSRSELAA